MNEIKKRNEIKNSLSWVNVNFQAQSGNRDPKHFSQNFIPKNIGDVLNILLKLIDDENKEKNIWRNSNQKLFAWTFGMSKSFKKTKKAKQKIRKQYIKDLLLEFEKDLANFQLTVQKTKQNKTIQNYVRL